MIIKLLIENKSTSTYENIKYSYNIIKKKISYSTTNYHVFRAGVIASNMKIKVEGIGAKTKSYYWVNAFIREFVASIVSEKMGHLKMLLIIAIILLIYGIMSYLGLIL